MLLAFIIAAETVFLYVLTLGREGGEVVRNTTKAPS